MAARQATAAASAEESGGAYRGDGGDGFRPKRNASTFNGMCHRAMG
jgi:hypothetical protein